MKLFAVTLVFMVSFHESLGQIGVKTYRPASSGSSDFLYHQNLSSQGFESGTHYVQSGGHHIESGSHHVESGRGEFYHMSELDLFLNKTRSEMAAGVCYKEVPTATLVHDSDMVPAGNGSNPSMSRIMVCCEGYERNMHNFKQCDPICRNECPNGICVAPNECSCYPDHVRNLGGFCIPTCPIGCGNGDCGPDRSCICKPGYVLDSSRKFCVPECRQGCGANGNCTAPNICECKEGYEATPEGGCNAKCDNCINGQCLTPGVCTCRPGYMKKDGRCEPVCPQGCENGFCSAPNVCSCKPGWASDPSGRTCVPSCDQPCLNGVCSGSNTCTCNQGYIIDEYNPHICNPHCPNGCPNGICSGPNFCICNPGYIKDRGVKGREVCRQA